MMPSKSPIRPKNKLHAPGPSLCRPDDACGFPLPRRNRAVCTPFLFADGTRSPNRLCIQPLEGRDAGPDGSPGELTRQRYLEFASGGAGMIWFEAIAVSLRARASGQQLCLQESNLHEFRSLVDAIRATAARHHRRPVVILAQLAHPGRYSLGHDGQNATYAQSIDDRELAEIGQHFIAAARLARRAGFDGVDIKCSHNDLLADLLHARNRHGPYGGSFAHRARLLFDIFDGLRPLKDRFLLASRLSIALPALQNGKPVKDARNTLANGLALREATRLIETLSAKGLRLINPHFVDPGGSDRPDEGPTGRTDPERLDSCRVLCRGIKEKFPSLALVFGGFSARLADRLAETAHEVVAGGTGDFYGLGRAALAAPDAAGAIASGKSPDPLKSCLDCGACEVLLNHDQPVGCVVRKAGPYAETYRRIQRFSLERLQREARRCRNCRSADCAAACPARMDVPGFLRAFAQGDFDEAYSMARSRNPLPEISAWLCPAWMFCETRCVEQTLCERAIPIRDIQIWLGSWGRRRRLVSPRIPAKGTGKNVAVAGGGPAGIAAAATLVEAGHGVVIYERAMRLGGVPALTIPRRRLPDEALAEIDRLLAPAIESGRLRVSFGRSLGKEEPLALLQKRFDAVLLATGLWHERERAPGKERMDALTFLRLAKSNALPALPRTIAILCGGDCAMDATAVALDMGVEMIYLLFSGPLSEMHWHESAERFREKRITVMPMSRVTGRKPAADGGEELRIIQSLPLHESSSAHAARRTSSDRGEYSLRVGMVIEALGLDPELEIRAELRHAEINTQSLFPLGFPSAGGSSRPEANIFAAGALVNGGASVIQCIREGVETALTIHDFLSKPK